MIDIRPEEAMVHGIIAQAVKDYEELMKKSILEKNNKFGEYYSVNEIERFFKSKWCEYMLIIINCDIKGADIWNMMCERYGKMVTSKL